MDDDCEDDELYRLLDLDHTADQHPLTDLLRAAAASDPDGALSGEEAAVTAFLAAWREDL